MNTVQSAIKPQSKIKQKYSYQYREKTDVPYTMSH